MLGMGTAFSVKEDFCSGMTSESKTFCHPPLLQESDFDVLLFASHSTHDVATTKKSVQCGSSCGCWVCIHKHAQCVCILSLLPAHALKCAVIESADGDTCHFSVQSLELQEFVVTETLWWLP